MSDVKHVKVGCSPPSLLGLLLILGAVFVTLKLCGVIAWSWWLVCLPFLLFGGLLALGLAFAALFVGLVVVAGLVMAACAVIADARP